MSSLEFVGKYIGDAEITSVSVSDKKTPGGGSRVLVVFKTGQEKEYSEKVLPYIITDKASDASTVQEKRLMPVIRECMNAIIEYDMDYGDIESFSKQLFSNLSLQYDRAENFLWGKEDKEFVPGFDSRHGVSLLQVHDTLGKIESKNEGSDSEHQNKSN